MKNKPPKRRRVVAPQPAENRQVFTDYYGNRWTTKVDLKALTVRHVNLGKG